jgi:hypothetical protein
MKPGRRPKPSRPGLSGHRALVWYRRILALLASVIVLLGVLWWHGLPVAWVAPATSFLCAEITRRIMSEANPGVPMRWRDILAFAWSSSSASPPSQRPRTRDRGWE